MANDPQYGPNPFIAVLSIAFAAAAVALAIIAVALAVVASTADTSSTTLPVVQTVGGPPLGPPPQTGCKFGIEITSNLPLPDIALQAYGSLSDVDRLKVVIMRSGKWVTIHPILNDAPRGSWAVGYTSNINACTHGIMPLQTI